ncbi:MAG: TonB-dependent receptor [candidate division KSB1 bacterium]|nr:TonB-dependent receptor [candidate division KSB1 bacterium]
MKTCRSIQLFLVLLIFVLVVPTLLQAQVGKIRGTVKDAETGDPLPGANVVLEGTSIGAASDLNGVYIILNVPPGKYNLVTSFIGYKTMKLEGLAVHSGSTTSADITLSPEVIPGESVLIVAERPLVDKNVTHEVHTVRTEEIENIPVRGTQAVLTVMPGVVREGNNFYVRGGRSTEMAYYVEGINVTMPDDGANGLAVIHNAIEEISYHAGGFGAEFGTRMSGQLFTTLKSGTPNLRFGGEVISDDFWATKSETKGYQILGLNKVYSYGYDDYILWSSGPVPFVPDLKFYAAGQRYWRSYFNGEASWFEGFTESDSVLATAKFITSGKDAGKVINDTLRLGKNIPPGRYPAGGEAGWIFNGNFTWDRKPFRVKLGGTYNIQRDHYDPDNPITDPRNLWWVPARTRLNKRNNYSAYLGLTHLIDPTTFYTLNLNYFTNKLEFGDPLMGWSREDWPKWGDPAVNPALVDTSRTRSLQGPGDFSILYPGTPYAVYGKNYTNMLGAKLDFTKQLGTAHEFKLGGELNYYTIRMYRVNARLYLQRMVDAQAVAETPNYMTDWDFYRGLDCTFTGYDIHGEKEVNEDEWYTSNVAGKEVLINAHNAPGHPIFAGAYLQDRIELRDLIINAGVRLDYIDNGVPGYKDLRTLTMGTAQTIADSNFTDSKKFTYLSPRLGFSFPVTDRVIFHAQYGRYIQPTRTDMRGTGISSYGYMRITQFIYGGGYAVQVSNPNLKPERQTTYEFGFKESFSDIASLDITAFYKDTRDLTTMRVVFPLVPDYRAPYFNMNQDFGTVKGLSFTFNLRRTHRIQATANYTYSDAKGTGSEPRSHFDICWTESTPVFPVVIGPLDFDQRHKGWIDLDVRFNPDDGPSIFGIKPLSQLGLNLSFNFHSGSPYTRVEALYGSEGVWGIQHPMPLEPYNRSTLDWFYQLDLKLDKSFKFGPVNMNAYIWAINALNIKGFTDGFRATGRPDDDGWLATENGKAWAKIHGPEGVKWFKAIMTRCGSRYWQDPRTIRAGLKFEL